MERPTDFIRKTPVHRTAVHFFAPAVLLPLVFVIAACGGGGNDAMQEITVPATFQVQPGVEQVTVTGAPPKAMLTISDASGKRLLGLIADDLGQALFAYIPDDYIVVETGNAEVPTNQGSTLHRGDGYTIRNESTDPVELSEPFSVMGRDDLPDEGLYDSQTLDEGFNYIEVRDGVKLSAMVRFPDPANWGPGPWPTVIEYSGYSPSNPYGEEPGSTIADLLGYATVGVNMRGTGCSGGVFDVFNPAQQADGYDMVEVIARQPWVLHNKVGMVGLSYSGISQLYVASTRPPSLAAVTPLSVIEDPWRQQWPGGVYNDGFTREWLEARDAASRAGGQSWVKQLIDEGDTTCAENQDIRTQNIDFEQFGRVVDFYPPEGDDRRLGVLVRNIEVPVYLTGAWQDEQTGSRFATMLDDFVSTDTKKFILFNGRHPDGYSPTVITRWWEFLEFYVAKRIPRLNPLFRGFAQIAFQQFFDVPGLGFEPDRFPDFTDYDEALAAYEAEPTVRVLFEVGNAHPIAGAPVARYETSFDAWPPPGSQPHMWFLGSDSRLLDQPPSEDGTDTYEHDPEAGAITYSDTSANDFVLPQISFHWPPLEPGFGVSYLTEPLQEDLVVAGNGGYVNLWFASEAQDVNVEATITEVQPDGTEFLVQSGVFRVGNRGIDEERSDTFLVEYTYAEEDFRLLTPGELTEIKVPIRPFSHAFRAGSRIRLIIDTPGRDSPLWAYENPGYGGATVFHQVAYGPERVSFLLLPTVDGVDVPEGFPPCPSLRGLICRPFVPFDNEVVP